MKVATSIAEPDQFDLLKIACNVAEKYLNTANMRRVLVNSYRVKPVDFSKVCNKILFSFRFLDFKLFLLKMYIHLMLLIPHIKLIFTIFYGKTIDLAFLS